jgi:hypothetical protein
MKAWLSGPKQRVPAQLMCFGHACPVSDRFERPGASCWRVWISRTRGSRVRRSGSMDRRGPLAKTGPKYLCWALMEATGPRLPSAKSSRRDATER